MIKITKELQRPDKGIVPTDSLVNYTARFLQDELTVVFDLVHWLNQEAKDGEWLPIPKVIEFDYRLSRLCTVEEWMKLDDAGASSMVEEWLKEVIDGKIGVGYTEIL